MVLFFTIFLTVIVGCDGEAGPPGISHLPSDLHAPEVMILLPDPMKNLYDMTFFEVYVTDDDTVERVEFLIDGVLTDDQNLVMTQPPWQVRWDCSSLSEGSHLFQARAWDRVGSVGLSPAMIFYKSNEAKPPRDTLRSFIDLEDDNYFWTLPDHLGRYDGIGVRFSPNALCALARFYVNIYVDTSWTGTGLFSYEIWNSKDNYPDTLMYADTTSAAGLIRNFEKGFSAWGRFSVRNANLRTDKDFFVLINPIAGQSGDSLGLFTDDGAWRTFRGVFRQDGRWKSSGDVIEENFNPLIYMIVDYQ